MDGTTPVLDVPSISYKDSLSVLSKAIRDTHHGVFILEDLPTAPFDEIQTAFDHLLDSETGKYLQKTGAMVTKSSRAFINITPENLDVAIATNDSSEASTAALTHTQSFFQNCMGDVTAKLLVALADAVGCPDTGFDEQCSLRMLDYYAREASTEPSGEPSSRHGEHRDFGTLTINFTNGPGLQAFVDGVWHDIPGTPAHSAALFFGWVTQIRSNGRVPAVLHRVVDADPVDGRVRRRNTATLFVAPTDVNTHVEPALQPAERLRYMSGLRIGQLIPKFAATYPKAWWKGNLDETKHPPVPSQEAVSMSSRL